MSTASKSIGIVLLFLAALILAPAHQAVAETYAPITLYDQPVDPAGGLYQSSWWSAGGTDYDEYLWDDFTLPYTQDITAIRWRGGFDPDKAFGSGPLLNFTVAIFGSAAANTEPDHPSGPLVTYTMACDNNACADSPQTINGVETYNYQFSLPVGTPFHAQGGTKYWVYIVGAQDGRPNWSLSKATGGDSYHFREYNDSKNFGSFPGDLAFTLLGPTGVVSGLATADPPYEIGGLTLDFSSLGTDLDCVEVMNVPNNHPAATVGIQTGQYWILKGFKSDCSTPAQNDFNFDLKLPHKINPNNLLQVCKFPGDLGGAGWDCARTDSNGNFVWRNGINSGFSDWSVGDNVTPTALTVNDLSAAARVGEQLALAAILFGAFAAAAFTWKIWRRRAAV